MHHATYRMEMSKRHELMNAVRAYQGHSASTNSALRTNGRMNETAQRLDELVRQLPVPVSGLVYRGMGDGVVERAGITVDPGSAWTEPSFLSTSRRFRIAREFGTGGVVLRLRILEPIPAIPIHWVSKNYDEYEVVFPPGCGIRIERVRRRDERRIVDAILSAPESVVEAVSAS